METTKLNAAEICKNMTQGKWESEDKRSLNNRYWICNDNTIIAEVLPDCHVSLDENADANAGAIVSAVNNTWNKNINPECVPELLEALKAWVDYHDSDMSEAEQILMAQTKKAISKATITP